MEKWSLEHCVGYSRLLGGRPKPTEKATSESCRRNVVNLGNEFGGPSLVLSGSSRWAIAVLSQL